jgi:type VI secretion system secreted protein VgrG
MHFDRDGMSRGDHETSCWVPVSQTWAGPGYGTVFIPRVGMEVVIHFIAGDPDRPLCTGVIYNGQNSPPYGLPDHRTRSVIKTASSPGGKGFNELSFEDAAGNEEIFVHAQKNLREVVKACHTTSVGGSQSDSVGGDHTVTIRGNQTNTVEKDQTESVTGNVTVNVTGTRTTEITGKETLTLLDARETWVTKTELHQVTEMLTETFDGGRTTFVAKGDGAKVTSGDKSVEVVDGQLTVSAKTKISLAQKETHCLVLEDAATLSTSTDFTVTNGKVSVSSDGGALTLSAADELSLCCGSASIVLKKDGSIEIQGSSKVSVGTPGTSFTAEPSGATVNGAKIVSQAIGVHEVKGALVKIN